MIFSALGAKVGLGASLALGLALLGTGLWGLHHKSERQKIETAFAEFRAEANRIAAQASEAYRLMEQAAAERVRKAEAQFKERQAQNEKALASVRAAADADRRLLVNRIAELGSSPSPEASASAPGEGTGALGDLLAEGLQLQAELAGEAESNADAYRALREAWPD
jgi:hypothetical protein